MQKHSFSTANSSKGLRLLMANSELPFRLLLWPLLTELTLKRTIKVLFIIFTMIVAALLLPSLTANAPIEGLELKSVPVHFLFHPARAKLVYFCRVAQRCFAAVSDT